MKKKFDVTLYYHTNVTISVMAKDEKEAIENAENLIEDARYNEQLLSGLQRDSAPDVVCV